MNQNSIFKKSKWANGQPSIEIDPYDYSKAGFERILSYLAKIYSFEKPEISVGLDKIMTSITINGEKVEVDMDNWTCSLGFESEKLRDEVMNHLKSSITSQLAESIEIKSPGKAYDVVESLKDLLKRGLIAEVGGNSRLSEIERGKPWPNDVIEIEFLEHATSYRFKLSIETYHGSGGSFKRIA